MKKTSQVILFLMTLLMLFCSSQLWAWSYTGHVVIAQMAYQQLTPSAKMEADRLAKLFFAKLSSADQQKLRYYYPNVSLFAQLASLPDNWRLLTIGNLFAEYNAVLPANLYPYANSSSSSWHFINQTFPDTSRCHTQKTPNIVSILPLLITDLSQSSNDQTKALSMIFIEHLVGDIHQPLHTLTLVNKYCTQDFGGTASCLKRNYEGRCIKNLHQLWDGGVGLLKPKSNILSLAYHLQQQVLVTSAADINHYQQWAMDNLRDAGFIYSIMNVDTNVPQYYRIAHRLVKRQLVLASNRLAAILNNALNKN